MQGIFYGLNRSLGGAIGAIAVVSCLSGALALAAFNEVDETTQARTRSNEIVLQLGAFRAAMLNQETALRGYLLTGSADNLQPYRLGRPALDAALARLGPLVAGTPQAGRLAEAEKAARSWQTEIAERAVADMADPSKRQEAIERETSLEAKQRFDAFRSSLNAVQAQERDTLGARDAAVALAERNARIALWVSIALTLAICAAIGLAVRHLIAAPLLKLADAMRRLAERDLEVEIPSAGRRNEVGEMARAVQVFKNSLIELDRTSILRATADTLPALVGYVDNRRRIGFLNSEFARWYDLGSDDVAHVYGRPLSQVFARDSFPGAKEELEAAFAGQEAHFEHTLVQPGSSPRDLEAYYRPHRSANGGVLGVVTLLTDITERKRMERRLAQQATDLIRSNEELEQFAYVASHDLKAPLRGIENLVTWIEEDLEGSLVGETRDNMNLVKNRVQRLESLLDDLLAYSRAGRENAGIESVDAKGLVNDLAALVSPPEGFVIKGSDNLPVIKTARAPLTQVLQNLIGNAIKHHDRPSQGTIYVDSHTLPNFIEFVVSDDGPGVPERFRERVFGMFQTLRPRDQVEGSGMGLAIVKKLVERYGGRVWLSDRPEGRGLAAHFTWPLRLRENADGPAGQLAASGRR